MKSHTHAKVIGTVGGIGTVGAIGIGATGSSAAAMTTTLATIGGVVGGGMATGIIVIAVAPLAVGGICYGLYKWLKD